MNLWPPGGEADYREIGGIGSPAGGPFGTGGGGGTAGFAGSGLAAAGGVLSFCAGGAVVSLAAGLAPSPSFGAGFTAGTGSRREVESSPLSAAPFGWAGPPLGASVFASSGLDVSALGASFR